MLKNLIGAGVIGILLSTNASAGTSRTETVKKSENLNKNVQIEKDEKPAINDQGIQFFTYKGFNPLLCYGLGLSFDDKILVKASVGYGIVLLDFNAGVFYKHTLNNAESIYTGLNYLALNAMTISYDGAFLTIGYKHQKFSVELGGGLYREIGGPIDAKTKLGPGALAAIYWWSK